MISRENRIAALMDPVFHRWLMFRNADEALARAFGRELEWHEKQSRFPEPQLEIVNRVERAIRDRNGDVITVLLARQTGKNETEALLECRALAAFSAIPDSKWVRTAPTHKPQVVNSKHRLEKFTNSCPILAGRVKRREGYIVQHGEAQVFFLSAGKAANVVGATASIALSIDEAHKIDRGKFEEDLMPFTASTNAPTILWGVAGDKLDLLHEYREQNEGTDRLLVFPAAVWCENNPAYAKHYENRRSRLGADHPVILTQYDLVAVDSVGGYLNSRQRASLFSGDHERLSRPRDGLLYGCVVDVGGESEVEADDAEVRMEEAARDSTVAWVFEWEPRDDGKFPDVRVVDGVWWTGRPHIGPNGDPNLGMVNDLVTYLRHWCVTRGVIDARGVGEPLACAVARELPCVEPYKANSPDVSEDCYDLLARLNASTVKFWRADPASDEELREIQAQARHTKYQIRNHDQMRLTKPTGQGSSFKHIDGIKALTYLHRALFPGSAGAAAFEEETTRGRFNPFEGRVRVGR